MNLDKAFSLADVHEDAEIARTTQARAYKS